jgi:hypothetical protein
MAVVASFVVFVGAPLLLAARLDALRVRWFTKVVLLASVPALMVLLLYVPSYSLDEVGVPAMLAIIAWAWLVGFVFGPLLRGLWRFANRFARPSW